MLNSGLSDEVVARFVRGAYVVTYEGTQISTDSSLQSPTVGVLGKGTEVQVRWVCREYGSTASRVGLRHGGGGCGCRSLLRTRHC